MVNVYLLVNLVAIAMSGEIHNRVEDLPFNFPEKKDKKITNGNVKQKEVEDENAKEHQCLSCEICKVRVTSAKIFQRHLDGRKHKLRTERQGKEYKCDLCDLTANSEIQLQIHLRSARHKAKLQKKEYPNLSHFNFLLSKTSWLKFVIFICVLLNLFLLSKLIF